MRHRTPGREIHCERCDALLGVIDVGGRLSIHRGKLQATISGDFEASIVCYRPDCKTLNVLRLIAEPQTGGVAA